MSESAEKLKPLLAALPASDRDELVDYLLELGDSTDEELTREEWEEAWVEECNRRLEAMRSGQSVGTPAEEVMKRLKEKHG